jgi:hypothetical protein
MMILLLISVNCNGVIEVVLAGVEMLWVGVPSGVEEHFVDQDVSQEDGCSVLLARPPWGEGVKALSVLIWDACVDGGVISNCHCLVELCIVVRSIGVLEDDFDLRVAVSIHAEVDRPVEVDLSTKIFDDDLIDWLDEARLPVAIVIRWI